MTDLRSTRKIGDDDCVAKFGRRLEFSGDSFNDDRDDLRKLEAALRNAYVTKELQAQICEAEAARVSDRAREQLRCDMLQLAADEAANVAEEKLRREKNERLKYGVELMEVVSYKEEEKLREIRVNKKEREILEEVSKVIEENVEKRKTLAKRELAERQLREIRIFRELKEIRKQEEEDILEDERRREIEYLKENDRRIEELRKKKVEQNHRREMVVEIVAKSLIEAREKKLRIEAIVDDLIAEEKIIEEEMKLREEENRRRIAMEETVAENERHMIVVEERKLRHAIEEEEFAIAVMRKVLMDARIERLTQEARKRKQIEYRKALERIIQDRRNHRNEEILRLKESLLLEQARDLELRKRVKEIRERLLLQHAGNVAEFIASGVLSAEERAFVANFVTKRGEFADSKQS